MIKSFRCRETEKLFNDRLSKQFSGFQRVARRKLEILEAAVKLHDLRSPPGNRLEQLSGNRRGQYSIRINDQFRICFVWSNDAAWDVEIVDYH
jgi:proteic killer suppression protein